jgi:hypothetical protein
MKAHWTKKRTYSSSLCWVNDRTQSGHFRSVARSMGMTWGFDVGDGWREILAEDSRGIGDNKISGNVTTHGRLWEIESSNGDDIALRPEDNGELVTSCSKEYDPEIELSIRSRSSTLWKLAKPSEVLG